MKRVTVLRHRNHGQYVKLSTRRKENEKTARQDKTLGSEDKKGNTETKAVEAKIAKTEQSIDKLEKHLANRTCPKSLQYAAKPNFSPDTTFDREIRDIKQQAEQSLGASLTRLHK